MLTANEISLKTGISRQAVMKKPFLDEYLVSEVSFGGRPQKYFRDEILLKFGISIPSGGQLAIEKIDVEPQKITSKGYEMTELKVRKRSRNSSAGKSRLISEELEAKLKALTFQYYLGQSRRDNIRLCADWACRDLWSFINAEIKGSKDLENFSWQFYNGRLMRRDEKFTGFVHSENWKLKWDSKHNVNKFNSSLPTNSWNGIELLTDAGIIGKGFGAGALWVVDGTQFDAWIDDNGKKRLMSYLMIMDGVTGMPMFLDFLENGEKTRDVAELLWRAVQIHGKPKLGIVMDNGAAFKSKEIRHMIRSWYNPAELEEMRTNSFRKRLFDGQTEPYLLPLPKIPRYKFKATIERTFDEINRFHSEQMALSCVGTRDSRAISHELGSTPTRGVNAAPAKEVAFAKFLNWIYSDFVHRIQPKHDWMRKEKIKPTLINLWQYFGGTYNGMEFKDSNDLTALVPYSASRELPNNAEYFAKYAMAEHHIVKASPKGFVLTEDKRRFNFVSFDMDLSLTGKSLSVAVDGEIALIFKEWKAKEEDWRTPDRDSLYFVGTAYDASISSVAKMDVEHLAGEARKAAEKELAESILMSSGGVKVEVHNQIESAKSKAVELAEYVEVEEITIDETKKLEDINEISFVDFLNNY